MKKTQVLALVTAILKQYSMNKRHSFDSCEMTQVLKEWLTSHERFSRHVATNKFVIKNMRAGGRRVKALHLVSENSGSLIPLTKTKISSLFGKPVAHSTVTRAKVISALRESITYQIDEYKNDIRELREELVSLRMLELARALIICPLTGKFINSGKTHVDHVIPFIVLLDRWLESCTSYNYFKDLPCTTKYGKVVLDKSIKRSWQDYHRKHCVLQIASARANVKKGSSGYRSKH